VPVAASVSETPAAAAATATLPPPPQPSATFVPLSDTVVATPESELPPQPDPLERTRVHLVDETERVRRRGWGRMAAVIAVVVALALGAAALALTRDKKKVARPPATTAVQPPVHQADTALRQTFPTVQLGATPALVSQLWSTSSDRKVLTATISVSNASAAPLQGTLRVIVPKAVAPTVDSIKWVPKYSAVIKKDPKVAYRMKLKPGGRFVVHYQVRFTKPLSPERFKALAKAETRDLANDAKQLGQPVPKLVAVSLSVDPKAGLLVITNDNRQPRFGLHVTESFAGVVLHDPVLWRSTRPSVADVDANGVVTGYSKGTTTIQATVGTASVSVPVTVLDGTTTTTASTPTTHAPPATTPRTQPPTTAPRTTTTHAPTTTTTLPPTTTTTTAPITTTTSTPVTIPPVPANPDVNGDGVVGCIDAGLVNDYIGTTSAAEDINGDGVVDSADLAADLAAYTQPNGDGTTRPDLGCPPP
jgi:hypothetical protein